MAAEPEDRVLARVGSSQRNSTGLGDESVADIYYNLLRSETGDDDDMLDPRLLIGRNLCSVMNDPTVRFTPADWPFNLNEAPPPCDYLPSLSLKDFAPYLMRIAVAYNTHERRKAMAEAREAEGESGIVDVATLVQKRAESAQAMQAALADVPEVFFSPDFSLRKPAVFAAAVSAPNIESIRSMALTQERLSHYTDTVEIQLASSITAQSSAFFSALSTIRGLHTQVSLAVKQIGALRAQIAALDCNLTANALTVGVLRQRRVNMLALLELLGKIEEIRDTQPTIQLLLSTGDYCGALDLIHHTLSVLRGELASVACLRHMSQQLTVLVDAIGEMVEEDFNKLIDIDAGTLLRGKDYAAMRHSLTPVVECLLRLGKLNACVVEFSNSMRVTTKTIVSEEIRRLLTIERALSEKTETSLPETLAEELQNLEQPAFENVLSSLCRSLTGLVEHAAAVRDVVCELAEQNLEHAELSTNTSTAAVVGESGNVEEVSLVGEGAGESELVVTTTTTSEETDTSPTSSPPAQGVNQSTTPRGGRVNASLHAQLTRTSVSMVFSVMELCHVRVAKILAVRQERHSKLRVDSFCQLLDFVLQFITTTEQVCGKQSQALRGTMQGQAGAFLKAFHESRKAKLALLLEHEQWSATAVPREIQAIVDKHLDDVAEDSDSEKGVNGTEGVNSNPVAAGVGEGEVDDNGLAKTLVVGGRSFSVVSCTLLLLQMIDEYLECSCKLHGVFAVEVAPLLVELLLLFNQKSCELVLGKGAVETVGLKSISAKHLVLMSEMLACLLMHIRYVKERLSGLLTQSQQVLLRDFDRVVKDYYDHRCQILQTFVAMMKERVAFVSTAASTVDWTGAFDDESPPVNAYMKDLVKDTCKLHKVLAAHLPESDLEEVFVQVFEEFNAALADMYSEMKFDSSRSRHRLYVDLKYYEGTLNNLAGVSGPGMEMDSFYRVRFGKPPV